MGWPPPGYTHYPTATGSLACCTRCGALVGDTELHDADHACESSTAGRWRVVQPGAPLPDGWVRAKAAPFSDGLRDRLRRVLRASRGAPGDGGSLG